MDDAIRRRAIAFAETFNTTNIRVVSIGPANPELVQRFGDPATRPYGEVRLLMEWSDIYKSQIVGATTAGQQDGLRDFMNGDWELVVVCSESDVIHHYFPHVDLD